MLEILRSISVGKIIPNISVNRSSRVNFTSLPDSVELQSLDRFFTESAIKRMLLNNPKIKNIVKSFNPELRLNMEELRELQAGHAKDTQNIVKSIMDNLPYSIQNNLDKKQIETAAYLHDIGKVLIPKEILNKPARLTPDERKIMDTHSEIGYELLKNSGISEKTLNLIRNHHKKPTELNRIFQKQPDYALQILATADKYSALLEKRVYKDAMTPQVALSIIHRDVENGELNQKVFLALAKQAQNNSLELLNA